MVVAATSTSRPPTGSSAKSEQRAAGVTRILIDLGDVDFIDSTGLRLLLTLRNDAERNAHGLALVPPAPPARRLFTITGTRALFDWELDRAGS